MTSSERVSLTAASRRTLPDFIEMGLLLFAICTCERHSLPEVLWKHSVQIFQFFQSQLLNDEHPNSPVGSVGGFSNLQRSKTVSSSIWKSNPGDRYHYCYHLPTMERRLRSVTARPSTKTIMIIRRSKMWKEACLKCPPKLPLSKDYWESELDGWYRANLSFVIRGICFLSETYHNFQHHVAATSVVLSWSLILNTVGRSPGIGLYITMFQKVAMIFFRLILIYFWLILGSALGFYILFRPK